jgi:hypothetical protein
MPDNMQGAGGSSYGQYTQDHSYETDPGVTSAHRVIRLHGGLAMRRVKWTATRTGKPPIIPTPVSTNSDRIIAHSVTTSLPTPNTQTLGYDWAVNGEYLYVQATPRIAGTHTLPTGGYPFPMGAVDSVASAIISSKIGNYTTPTVGAINPIDSLMTAIGEDAAHVDHDEDKYLWPFTSLPKSFTSDRILSE